MDRLTLCLNAGGFPGGTHELPPEQIHLEFQAGCSQGHNPSVGVSTEDLDYANFAFGRKRGWLRTAMRDGLHSAMTSLSPGQSVPATTSGTVPHYRTGCAGQVVSGVQPRRVEEGHFVAR